jgi:predicted lactoylglutathione lyase
MELGAFSISLAVKDIEASRAFYEKICFKVFTGDASQHFREFMARNMHAAKPDDYLRSRRS